MKKSIPIIFAIALSCITRINAGPFEALGEAQKQITGGQTKIADSIQQLKKAYIKTEDEVVDEIGKQVAAIKGQHEQLKTIYTLSETVRDTLPASIPILTSTLVGAPVAAVVTAMVPVFGDCPELIKSIRDTVSNIIDTLNNVKDTMAPANEKLNPLTDPHEIFYKLTKAQLYMKKGSIILTMITNKIQKIVERAQMLQKPASNSAAAGHRIVIPK